MGGLDVGMCEGEGKYRGGCAQAIAFDVGEREGSLLGECGGRNRLGLGEGRHLLLEPLVQRQVPFLVVRPVRRGVRVDLKESEKEKPHCKKQADDDDDEKVSHLGPMVVDLLQVGDGPMPQELQGVVERPQSVQDVLLPSP